MTAQPGLSLRGVVKAVGRQLDAGLDHDNTVTAAFAEAYRVLTS